MQFLKNIQKLVRAQESLEDTLYSSVLDEVKSGMVMKDLWAKSLAHGDFDPDKTRAYYIRERVFRLKNKSKAINEYLRLVYAENELCDSMSAENSRHAQAAELHDQKLKGLEVEHQHIVNEISSESYRLGVQKNQAVSAIRSEGRKYVEQQAKNKKMLLIFGGAATGITYLLITFEVNPMFSILAGLVAFVAIVSAFVGNDDEERQIELTKQKIEDESPLLDLQVQHQKMVDKIFELRQRAPNLQLPIGKLDSARKRELEAEVQHLFNLEPM